MQITGRWCVTLFAILVSVSPFHVNLFPNCAANNNFSTIMRVVSSFVGHQFCNQSGRIRRFQFFPQFRVCRLNICHHRRIRRLWDFIAIRSLPSDVGQEQGGTNCLWRRCYVGIA